nr:MAG TPA: hypothetical protein [Caudoviricetes sp.]
MPPPRGGIQVPRQKKGASPVGNSALKKSERHGNTIAA